MEIESNNCVYKTVPEKLRYFMKKATSGVEGEFYKRMLAQIEEHIRHFGIEGDSGRHYEIGDTVVDGQLVGGEKDDSKGCMAVFRLPTLTEYLKDGLPVELVIEGAAKIESNS